MEGLHLDKTAGGEKLEDESFKYLTQEECIAPLLTSRCETHVED